MRCFGLHSVIGITVISLSVTALHAQEIEFNRDIRPILSENCFACHGPDGAHREAGLRLDEREAAIELGAIVPGEPDQSLMIERIASADSDLVMPPSHSSKVLSQAQRELLRAWIEQGATYQRHWAFEPMVWRELPIDETGWSRNAIDYWVAVTHAERGLTPNAEADRATWLRRVSFDLTGLPPTLEELDAFLADDSDLAYERVVDRLLASPAYGERMATLWLDVARYADTFGYQNDVPMEVWPWRDWVIDAFNRNLPYDQFLTEQIAGDLLDNATQEQRLATTFNRLHRQTNEGGSVAEEFRIAGIADRTTTAGTAFLGLTFECCRCHDHKFDPITQREFYQLSAFFSDIDEFGLYSHFTFTQPTPAMQLYQGDQKSKHETALAAVQQAEQHFKATREASLAHWQTHPDELPRQSPALPTPILHLPLDADAEGRFGNATRCNGDQEVPCPGAPELGRHSPFTISLWINPSLQQPRMIVLHQSVAAEDSGFRGLQLTLDNGLPEFSMIHFWPGNAVRVQSLTAIPLNAWTHLVVTHDGSGRADGIQLYVDGTKVEVEVERDQLTRDIRHRSEWGDMNVGGVRMAIGARFRDVGFRDSLVDELRLFDRPLSAAEVLSLNGQEGVPIDQALAIEHKLLVDDVQLAEARQRLQEARNTENEVVTKIRQIMVMQHSPHAQPTRILERGEYTSPNEFVSPGVPGLFEQLSLEGNSRLDLADWMTDPGNPLTSRVMANRMWHMFFGRGLVVTLEDFGSQGTPPSHPELLDHLALNLIGNQWNLKALCRHIVLSATYRQSSDITDAEQFASDPENRWFARGPKHRLSAEQLRDAVLASSGLLVREVGGPSVMPYQPAGLWEEGGTGKAYHQSTGPGLYRRSLYTFWKRTSPPPSMLTFDATSRESCTPRRELTTTPLQALVFLNDPQYVEAARVLAEQLLTKHQAHEARWHELFRRLLSRAPTPSELAVVQQLYAEQQEYFAADRKQAELLITVGERKTVDGLDAVELAATTIVVQTLFAYDEAIMLR